MKIDFQTYLKLINDGEYHFYDTPSEVCYFPYQDYQIDMVEISKELNKFGKFLNHSESFMTRKNICENDEEWKTFVQQLKEERFFVCEKSSFTYKKVKDLSFNLFNIPYDKTWINNYLTPHHIDGSIEYRCFDKDKILILNRAIHLTLHRYDELIKYIPNLKNNYEIWFELGCLIHDRNNEYPWRNIT